MATAELGNEAGGDDGEDALRAAAANGHLNVAQWLVEESGMSPDSTMAIVDALQMGHLNIVKLLVEESDEDSDDYYNHALEAAALKGHLNVVKWLVEHPDLEMNVQEAACCAANAGHLDVVTCLL